jgi:hypothetical protein
MQAQSVTLDFLKPVGTVVDLSDKFNARVGDSMTPFNLFVTEGGKPKALNGLHPELEAAVGDGELKDGKAVMSDNAKGIHWVGNADNVTGYNRLTLTFPAEVFPQSGFCYGHLILANDAGVRESSVDIWFKVLDGLAIMGLAADYYDSAIELELKKLKEANSQAEQRLSKMKATPEGFANLDDLKAKYPIGNSNLNVTVDDGHLWIWLNGGWRDCGQYQTPALDSELIKQIQDEQQKHDKQIAQNASDISDNRQQIAQNASDISDNRQQITANSNELIRLKSAGKLQDVHITDGNGNRIIDKNGYKLTGKKWLITTDTTLSQTNVPADAAAVGQAIKDANKFDPAKFGIPVLYLYSYRIYELHDKNTTLKNMVSYSFPYFNATGMLKKFKVQGRTSAGLPEKNYTLTFDRDYVFLKEFGYQNKYVIKANYTDFSQSKNVVSARVWGKVRHQHDSLSAITNSDDEYLADAQGNHILGITDPQLAVGKNAGAVDGMPIAVMVNDEFWGLYTLNVPKDGYMAKMPAKSGYAIVSVGWSNLGHQVDTGNTSDFGDVEIEYCGSSSTAWVQSSFNQMLTALNSNYDDKSAFDAALRDYLDIDSAIDYYCYSVLIDNIDGINSNFLFQTFNGKKWYIAAYDLDETFGTTKDFNAILRANSNNPISDLQRGIKHFGMTFENTAKNSRLFAQLWKYHKDDIIKRTQNLIDTVMSAEEVSSMFLEFAQDIHLYLYMQDAKRWRNKPYTSIVNINQITNWYSQRVAWAQKVIDKNIQ